MLIDLNEPIEMHSEMRIASELLIALIEYCYKKGITDGQFDEQRFLRLKSNQKFRSCCLINNANKMKKRVKELFSIIPTNNIGQFITMLKQDQSFSNYHEIANFRFSSFLGDSFPFTWSNELKREVANLFGAFYDDFFSYKSFGETENNRDRFKAEYRKRNIGKEYICPACLGPFHLDKSQLDHYFPKSYFPSLVIQPFNLVPVCIECNTSVGKSENKGKGNRVPAWPTPAYSQNLLGCLKETYFPYVLSAERKFKATVVGDAGRRRIEVRALTTANPEEQLRVRKHAETFNLDHTWSKRMPFHYNMLIQRTITEFSRICADRNWNNREISKSEVADFIWERLVLYSDEFVYTIGYQFEFISFAMWLVTTPDAFAAFFSDLNKRLDGKEKESQAVLPHMYDSYSEPIS